MVSDILSQDEIDALLEGVTGESDEIRVSGTNEDNVQAYTPGPQERIVRGRMPALELINERFARYLHTGLLSYMHRTTEVSAGPIRVQKYAEFVRGLKVPTSLNLVAAKPLGGISLFAFDPSLVFLVVDSMFGSDGRFHVPVEGRNFTETEQRIVQGLLDVIFAEYARSWKSVYNISFEFIRSEMDSQFANIATPSEMVISTTFSLGFGEAAADMHICFPLAMLEPIRDLLHSPVQSVPLPIDQRWITMVRKQLNEAELEITANLATASIALEDLIRLKPGDIIPITIPAAIEATVDEVPLFECAYGQHAGQYALKVIRLIAPPLDDATPPRN